jgi:hypothetical protein
MHLGDQPLRERVDDRDTHAVQPAGDLVAVASELPAGVQLGQDDLERRPSLLGHDVHRDPGSEVTDCDGVVRVEGDLDAVVPAREGLVDGIVDDLVDEVMKPARTGRPDVHPRPKPDRLEALQNSDVLGCIGVLCHQKSPANGLLPRPMKSIRSGGWHRPPDWSPRLLPPRL